jgi:preprotein translocase SecF subunit
MWLVQYVPTETKFDFMRFRRTAFPISAALSILTIVLFFAWGLNFGIDFKGGTLIEMQSKTGPADIVAIRERGNALGFGDVEVQQFGSPDNVSVRVALQEGGEQAQQVVVTRLRETFGADYDFRRIEAVGPRVSGELVQSGTLGVLFATLGVMLYLWFRFEWQFALGGVISTLHDLVLTIGFFSLTQIEFNMTSIAAILTILGYSINDTVVVYDRIREVLRKYKRLTPFELINVSLNSTLSRTIMTGISVFLVLIALALFGGEVIKGFAYAMLFGLVIGTYSSVFVAAPILVYLGLKQVGETAPAGVGKVPQPAE